MIKKLADFAELKLLIDEYNPANSDWNFRRGVLLDILVRIWPQDASLAERRPFASDEPCDANQAWHELVEKDDRTSPEEYPDMCLITFDELKEFMTRSRSPAVSDATYCPFCDLEHELHEDAQGFHHVIKGERIDCVGRVKPHAFRSSLRTALCEDCSGTEDAPWHSQPVSDNLVFAGGSGGTVAEPDDDIVRQARASHARLETNETYRETVRKIAAAREKALAEAVAERGQLRAQVERLTKVIDDRVADYADLEKNSRGGLTDLGKHAQRVVIGIQEQFACILAVSSTDRSPA